tara:strand:+ start:5880 stop:7094 length:1215 start_codon:yes stop_codon:yes gene_type:complete
MLAGCGLGIVTGLVPGIHINMVSVLVIASLPVFADFSPLAVACMIMAMSVTHTFLDFIPSVLFGAPESGTALSVLPGHRMLLSGRALEAIKLTGLGSLVSLLITAVVFIPVVAFLPAAYAFVKPNILYLLIFVCCISIGTEKKLLTAGFVFLLAGLFGFFLLNSSLFDSGIIFPALSGMFGISTMLLSLRGECVIPIQIKAKATLKAGAVLKNSFLGSIAGMMVGMLPGLGGAQATYLVQQVSRKGGVKEFLVAASGVNTANIIFTLVVLYALGKMRSGIVIAIDKIVTNFGFVDLVIFLGVILGAGGIAMLLHIGIGGFLTKKVCGGGNFYNKITVGIILLIVVSVIWLTGLTGLLVLVLSTIIGLIAPLAGVRRANCMAFFLVPVMLYYSGLNFWLMKLVGV